MIGTALSPFVVLFGPQLVLQSPRSALLSHADARWTHNADHQRIGTDRALPSFVYQTLAGSAPAHEATPHPPNHARLTVRRPDGIVRRF